MSECVMETTKKYDNTTRKLPAFDAKKCCNQYKWGNDMHLYRSLKNNKGGCRWVKIDQNYSSITSWNNYIDEQIRIFSQAEKIISPHGSNLSNIIFCKPGTEIYEIGPEFNSNLEKFFENRYKYLAEVNGLKYYRFLTDTVPVENHSNQAKKFINNEILENSNYYKNLIVKISDINKLD